jgi:hypothetical protein
MSQSIRFIGFAVLAWAGVRAVSHGLVPGTEAFAFDLPPAAPTPLPAVPPSQLPPVESWHAPVPPQMAYGAYPPYAGYPPIKATRPMRPTPSTSP